MAAGRSHRVISCCCKGMADMEIPSSFEGFVYLGQVDSTCAHDNDGTLARLFCHTLTMESCCCQLTLEASSLFHRVVLPTTAPWPGWKVVLFAGSCARKKAPQTVLSQSRQGLRFNHTLCANHHALSFGESGPHLAHQATCILTTALGTEACTASQPSTFQIATGHDVPS